MDEYFSLGGSLTRKHSWDELPEIAALVERTNRNTAAKPPKALTPAQTMAKFNAMELAHARRPLPDANKDDPK